MANKTTLRERIKALEVKVSILCRSFTDFKKYVKEQFENHFKTIENKEKEKRGHRHDWAVRIAIAVVALFQALMFAWLIKGKG